MVFSSVEFLFLFLPIALAIYWVVPRRMRNLVLLVSSLVFYTWGGGVFVVLLGISTVVDYAAGRIVASAVTRDDRRAVRVGVALSVAVNLALLGYFKYANFVVGELNRLGDALGIGPIAWTSIVLPIGISFFTFQSMSYTIDIATGRAHRLRNILDFALYVTLFPQLIAGPIVRYHEIADEIRDRNTDLTDLAAGAIRFSHGLVKKVVVADAAAVIADASFAVGPESLTFATAWFGVVAYTVQIYFDFSGYSDMAIGLGRMLGFTFPENFRRPYSALSITDFWRRWHITLSNWFRDYLYIPIGGSRHSTIATYRNLVIVFLLTGAWHGANWTFIAWGAYHGVLLIIERVTNQRPTTAASFVPFRRAIVLLAVMVGWVLFRSPTIGYAGSYLAAMFSAPALELAPSLASALTNRAAFITLAAAVVVVALPGDYVAGIQLTRFRGGLRSAARLATIVVALPYAVILTASGSFSPFLYFQF